MDQAVIIDDDEDYRALLVRKLNRIFPDIVIDDIDPQLSPLPDKDYPWDQVDFIILDYQLGIDITGLDWFKQFKPEEMPATILLTAKGSEEVAVKAIKLGIDDYIVKEHFDNETLMDSINECVYAKKQERAKLKNMTTQSVVFNKSNFIHRLKLITDDKEANHHLLLFNPEIYQRIGKEKGIIAQDNYIHHVSNRIYQYLIANHIDCNIFIYKEEYIAVIFKADSYREYLDEIYTKLEEDKFKSGMREYPCSCSIGLISPRNFEPGEFRSNDFELLSTAQVLCNSAKYDDKRKICSYGDISINDDVTSDEFTTDRAQQPLDMEKAIEDGRVSANYQPWVYISTDETINLKDIHDVRIEIIDTEGDKIPQRELINLLDNAFAKRVVDRWVLRNSVTQLISVSEQSGRRNKIKLAVRITLSSLSDPDFLPWLKELLDNDDLPNGCMLFEVESSHFLRDPDKYKPLIKEIGKKHDIKFVLSGIIRTDTYYDIRDLQRFDYVKLNVKDLIYGFPRRPLNDLIKAIRDDKAKIVAVNVDNAEMLTLATEFDIDYVEGYLVGRPYIDVIADGDGDLYCVI
jgi:EAL domain-containing protein (putative c-di-GMP-specific phosphodiesterase class I)/DNA-binding response OmpR family regulator